MVIRKLPTVVTDNTLLSRLTALEIADFLPLIFTKVLIPVEVRKEAFRSRDKRRLRNLLNQMSDFFVYCQQDDYLVKEFLKESLDEGEASAIAQAEYTGSALILDERKGHGEAVKRDLPVFRTTKILSMLKEAGFIPAIKPYLDKLNETGFYLSSRIYNSLLRKAGELE